MTEEMLRSTYYPWTYYGIDYRYIKLKGIGATLEFNMCREKNRVIYLSFYIDNKSYTIDKFQ